MSQYIGLDLHLETSTFGALNERAKQSAPIVVRTTGRDLIGAVTKFPAPRVLCLEEGTMTEWACELLRPHVEEIIVVQPEKRRGNKSDRDDAFALAEMARRGVSKRIFKPYGQLSELRTAARNYDECQRDVVRAKNRLLAAFRSRGIKLPKDYSEEDGREELLALLKAPYRQHAEALCTRLDAAMDSRETASTWLRAAAAKVSAVKLLMSVDGLGIVRAAQIVAVVVSPTRFRSRAAFWSYCGLGICSYSSADWHVDERGEIVRSKRKGGLRGLNRNRNPILKNAFVGAARTVSKMTEHPLAKDYQRLVERGLDERVARITIARRIATATLAVWIRKEEYDPAKHVARNPA